MTTTEKLYEAVRDLPEPVIAEILDFAEFLRSKLRNRSAISNDDRYIALSKTITDNNSDMYLLDTQSKQMKLISAHEGDVQFNPQYFSTRFCFAFVSPGFLSKIVAAITFKPPS